MDLASKLLVAIISVSDVWLRYKWLATTSPLLSLDGDHAEEPETTRGHLVGAQTLLGLELLFDVLDASLGAVMFVVAAVVVEHVLCEMRRPLLCVSSSSSFGARGTIWQENVHDLTLVVHAEDVLETTIGKARLRVSKLSNVAKLSKVTPLPVRGKRRLEGASEWKLAVRRGAEARESGFGSRQMSLSFEVRLLHRRGQLHVLPLGAILVFAAVHTTLPLLPGSEGFRTKLDAQLSSWFSGGIVLHSRGHAKKCFPEAVHGSGESGGHRIPEPLYGRADDAVPFAVCVREASALSFQGSLHVGSARCDAGLKRRCYIIVDWPQWSRKCHPSDV